MKIRSLTVALGAAVLAIALAVPALAGGRPLTADLAGSNEVPSSGSDATGFAELTLNQGQGEICFEITSSGYAADEAIVAGHIHEGAAGVNGGVVVNLQISSADSSGCVDVEPGLVKQIRKSPGDYYINLHSNLTPSGVIRGQLEK